MCVSLFWEEALLNVDQGHSQLVKYYNTLSGNRERPLST